MSKRGTPLKSGYLSAAGLSSMKMAADMLMIISTGNELLKNVNVDDLEP